MNFINYFTPDSINELCKEGRVRVTVELLGDDIKERVIDTKTGEPKILRTEFMADVL